MGPLRRLRNRGDLAPRVLPLTARERQIDAEHLSLEVLIRSETAATIAGEYTLRLVRLASAQVSQLRPAIEQGVLFCASVLRGERFVHLRGAGVIAGLIQHARAFDARGRFGARADEKCSSPDRAERAAPARKKIARSTSVEAPLAGGRMPAFSTESREAGSIVGNSRGRLDVVATPIGNLGDLSPRAQEVLAGADVIAAEDTRHTGTLLKAIGVSRPLVSLHTHNESNRVPELLARLAAGEKIALVSDAGTPLLSDPGYELVSEAARAGCDMHAIPGPSAIAAALTVAGLPTGSLLFRRLFTGAFERATHAAGSGGGRSAHAACSSKRLIASKNVSWIWQTVFGSERLAAVARELTKAHETTVSRHACAAPRDREDGFEFLARRNHDRRARARRNRKARQKLCSSKRSSRCCVKELPPSRAAAVAAQLTGARRNEAYALAMRLAKSDEAP